MRSRRFLSGLLFASLALSPALTLAAQAAPKAAAPAASVAIPVPKTLSASQGAVASVSGLASQVGVDVLKAGGNAVDAAIAVALALAVVYPEAGNLGGGGFMLLRKANGEAAALDYRETAPAAASRDMYLDAAGNLTNKSLVGALAPGVPGTVAGLEAAHQRYGKLPWKTLVAPAIALAERGFVVNDYLAQSMRKSHALLMRFPETRHVFMPKGLLPKAGETLRQPDLARTLKRIASEGAKGFYRGPVAEAIAKDMRANGGILTAADLAGYRPVWRTPVMLRYRGHYVISMPPPSSGGVTLAQVLNVLEGYNLRAAGFHSPQHLHWMIEAERRAYADRNAYLGDPDFVKDQPIDVLMSKSYAAKRRSTIDPDRATPAYGKLPGLDPAWEEKAAPSASPAAPAGKPESEETTHFSVVDRWGNAVSNTYTLNNNYGAGIVAAGTGVLMNDEMDDFAAKPGTPNLFGLVQGERNAIAPGKRMLSSMSPSIVLDPQGKLFMVVGSPGGSTIITTVMQVISNVIDFDMPLNLAVASPRVHHQGQPDLLYIEPDALDADQRGALVRYGHQVQVREPIGDVMAIRRLPDGKYEAVADGRRGGQAAGY